MDYEQMTAPCGMACFDCMAYLANENEELRARVARHFGIPPEHAHCNGCREVEGNCPMAPSLCKVFPCAEEKGVKFCYECSDFPCDNLHPYADKADKLPLNIRVFNLCLIRKMGLESWAKEKATSVKEEYFRGRIALEASQMTPDEHCKLLGKLVANFQSLEFILRGFLQELPSARQIGIPYATDIYSFPVNSELPLSEITNYYTLRELIKKFNVEMDKLGFSELDMTLVEVRDALAHGRVSSIAPDETLRLLKFSKPDKKGRVRVVFNQQLTEAWFEEQIQRVRQAILAVFKVIPE